MGSGVGEVLAGWAFASLASGVRPDGDAIRPIHWYVVRSNGARFDSVTSECAARSLRDSSVTCSLSRFMGAVWQPSADIDN